MIKPTSGNGKSAAEKMSVLLGTAILSAAASTVAFAEEDKFVDIVAWPGYIERGETAKGYDWAGRSGVGLSPQTKPIIPGVSRMKYQAFSKPWFFSSYRSMLIRT